jgi:hypothetical protein
MSNGGWIMRGGLFAALLAMGAPAADADETIRCGKWVVNSSLTVAELVAKCGEPASKDRTEEEVWTRNVHGGSYRSGTSIVEYWTYDRGSRAAPIRVKIVDGKIRSIERIL